MYRKAESLINTDGTCIKYRLTLIRTRVSFFTSLFADFLKTNLHCIRIVNGCVVSSCCCTVIEWLSQDRQRLADSAIWCKINDSKCRRKKGRKKGRENGRKAAFVFACAVGCHCAAGTTLLTSILVEISRDFMPETCRKQNAPRACSHSSHLR